MQRIDLERAVPPDARLPPHGAGDLATPSESAMSSPHRFATVMEAVDLGRAANTIPLLVGPGPETSPAVAPELWILHVRFERRPTPALGAALVEEYTPFALALARRWCPQRGPVHDVEHEALVALIGALDQFECGRCTPFPTFAVPTIVSALRRHHGEAARDQDEIDQVGRDLERRAVVSRAEGILMTRSQMTEPQARQELTRRSHRTGRDLHLVAAELIAEQDHEPRSSHQTPVATRPNRNEIDATPSCG